MRVCEYPCNEYYTYSFVACIGMSFNLVGSMIKPPGMKGCVHSGQLTPLCFVKTMYLCNPLFFLTSNYIIVTSPSFSPSHTINNLYSYVYILIVTDASFVAWQHWASKMCAPHLGLYVSKTMNACTL